MNKIIKNYFYNVVYQLFLIAIPLITAPYLSRVLGTSELGIYSYINSIITIVTTIGLIGMNNYGVRQIAYCGNNRKNRSKVFFELYVTRCFLFVFVSIFYFYFCSLDVNNYLLYYYIQYFLIVAIFFDVSWFFIGIESLGAVVFRNFIAKLVTVISIFIFVRQTSDLVNYFMIFSFFTLFTTLALYPRLLKYIEFKKININMILFHINSSLKLFLPQVAIILMMQLDKIMIQNITNQPNQVTFYSQGEKIVLIPLSLITAIGLVMMPRMAIVFNKQNTQQLNEYLKNTIRIVLMFAIPMAFGIASISKHLIPWYLGEDFIPVSYTIILLAPLILINSLTNISGNQYFTATDQNKILCISNIFGLILNVVLNYFLISTYGYLGATISSIFSALIILILQYYFLNKQVYILSELYYSIKYILISIPMFFFVYLIGEKFSTSITTTIMQVFVGIGTYIILLFLIKDENFFEGIHFVKLKYINRRKR